MSALSKKERAVRKGRIPKGAIYRVIDQPDLHSFYQAVRLIQLQLERSDYQGRIGHDGRPERELVRFSSVQHLGFAGRAIQKIDPVTMEPDKPVKVTMHVTFAGLTGLSATLPQHYTELVMSRVKNRDHAMKDFLDIFNHRLISLYYRSWEKYRIAEQIRPMPGKSEHLPARRKTDAFSHILGAATGSMQPLSLYHAGLFATLPRSATGLEQMLSSITGVPVRVKQFTGRWLNLASEEQTRLASRQGLEGQFTQLGVNASIGSRFWDVNSTVLIEMESRSQSLSRSMMPAGPLNQRLTKLVQEYVGSPTRVRWHLRIPAHHVSMVELGKSSMGLAQGGCLFIPRNKRNRLLDLRF
ncbi:type VI secretion system baseplate subunit TssG [Pokkaliibacter sp. CJK22405]|uniref:type VI secretion system baseplate subunit TssG n=1 Tax=Pokkaliibacter sp. CJK22405 TaxID=3384615 RepID=UPI003985352B